VLRNTDVAQAHLLTAIRQSDAMRVLARQSEHAQAPFLCPLYRREMVLRKGPIKIHHFAQKPPVSCLAGKGETELHHRAKLAVYDALLGEACVSELELERNFGTSVADVYAKISGIPVAIEIQRSILGVNEINVRTQSYHRLGIAVLWVALPRPDLSSKRCSPSAWEKWCHAAYYGRVYYWEQGQTLRVVHFDPYTLHIPSSSWYQDGSEQSAGGYDRNSKRWRTPNTGIPVSIAHSFTAKHRPAWSGGTTSVPTCTIYLDRQPKWWSAKA
jgi:competence protein CoiA